MGKSRLLGDAGAAAMKRVETIFILLLMAVLSACASLPRPGLTSDSLSPAEHVTLGDSYLSHGEKSAAIQQYQMAIAKDRHDVPALIALGNMSFEDHDLKNARTYFKRACQAAPQDAGAINNLAMVDLKEGKHLDRARRRIEQALLNAGSLAPYLLDTLANIEMEQGHYPDAKLSLEKAEAAAPEDDLEFMKVIHESREKLAKQQYQR